MKKEERIGIRINKETKEKLMSLSEESKRKMSDYLALLIEYAFETKLKL